MHNPNKYKASRTHPSQARGKERVRVILASALELFKERGVEDVTTNDIAEHAGIPIGSLYRYYPNKDAIIVAITELYANDVAAIFEEIREHPMLEHLSWEEVLTLMGDAWVNYTRLNGPFDFLYSQKANPKQQAANEPSWAKFVGSFGSVIKKRCPQVTDRQMLICFQLTLAAIEMGVSDYFQKFVGTDTHHEALGVVASYMQQVCLPHEHET